MKGGQPKPASLRALHGSRTRPRHRDEPTIPDVAENPAAAPPAPIGLVTAERAYWDRYAALLAGAKLLTAADTEVLADFCRASAAVDDRARRVRGALRRKIDPQIVRMWDVQLRQWVDRKLKLAGELGLTAISRTRVAWSGHHQVPPTTKPHASGALPAPETTLSRLQRQSASLRRPLGVDPDPAA